MKALVKQCRGADGVALTQVPEPIPQKNEIKIKVYAIGICGTDIHIMRDEFDSNPPVTMGHEYSGIVYEVGEDVKDFKPGDRVVSLTTVISCGQCNYCHAGLFMLCESRLAIGCGINGAFAEYLVIPADKAFKIPDEVSLEEAALCEPLACVVRSVIERATVKAGDYVYVSGPGTIGQLTMQAAIASGGKVVVGGTSIDGERLALASKLGAFETMLVNKEDIFIRTKEITNGYGFDVAFECAGVAQSADTCIRLLKKTGLYAQVGLYGEKIMFDHDLALKKEITMTNSFTSTRTSWERALRMLKYGQINMKPLISARLPIEEWKKGFDMVINKTGYKILLLPDDERQ
ncbi:zinc-binding dehydrogenase [Petroclostridium sp. X23]|uniref:zinc-dependent alcohol dehydrogenase n=1 Tax=Petroclostridium sp. X23 TaxID=3045146 RepID=UPI0024ADCC42|nr:zinc-binding dehydrogenase [Petroclostridium sp. X23]WHH57017.1 zinc-binding dehydrogenase [Petroclostridium sp. X23]